ncbi:hypothetical protein Droror1_Dr00018917 [Drosera rotundifolia]
MVDDELQVTMGEHQFWSMSTKGASEDDGRTPETLGGHQEHLQDENSIDYTLGRGDDGRGRSDAYFVGNSLEDGHGKHLLPCTTWVGTGNLEPLVGLSPYLLHPTCCTRTNAPHAFVKTADNGVAHHHPNRILPFDCKVDFNLPPIFPDTDCSRW